MDCEHVEKLLSPYLEDELSPEEKRIVDAHIHTCSSCADLLSLIRQTQESLASFPEVEVSENLVAQLYELPFKRKKFRFVKDFLLRLGQSWTINLQETGTVVKLSRSHSRDGKQNLIKILTRKNYG